MIIFYARFFFLEKHEIICIKIFETCDTGNKFRVTHVVKNGPENTPSFITLNFVFRSRYFFGKNNITHNIDFTSKIFQMPFSLKKCDRLPIFSKEKFHLQFVLCV